MHNCWPEGLDYFQYECFDCFIDYSAPNRSVGYTGSAWLVSAFAGGVDVTDYLAYDVIKTIEREACLYLSERLSERC